MGIRRADLLAQKVDAAVINAGDGTHEHPTQALLDALTIKRRKGRHRGPDSGDLRRYAAFPGRAVQHPSAGHAGQPGAGGRPADADAARGRGLGVEVFHDMAAAGRRRHRHDAAPAAGAHVAGPVPSEREYFRFFGLDVEKLAAPKPDALVMHPVR